MLLLNCLIMPNDDVKVGYEHSSPVRFETNGDGPKEFWIENPLVTFSRRFEWLKEEDPDAGEHHDIRVEAWACDELSRFWINSGDEKSKPQEKCSVVLARLAEAYLDEHYKLEQYQKH